MAESPLQSSITTSGASPQSATGPDGTSVQSHSLPDQIAADRYLASQGAKSRKGRGIAFKRLTSPSPAGVDIRGGGR